MSNTDKMETLREIDYKGYKIKIHTDPDPINPREWDELGTMFCKHRNYALGDESAEDAFIEDEETGERKIRDDIALVFPLFLYDHSGISISMRSFVGRAQHAEWDSGMVGVVYVTKKKMIEEYKRITKATLTKAERVLRAEVQCYDDYLTGNVYGYTVESPDGRDVGSCWGYFPDHPELRGEGKRMGGDWIERELGGMIAEAKAEADGDIEQERAGERPVSSAYAL